jgi:hypothetical protein
MFIVDRAESAREPITLKGALDAVRRVIPVSPSQKRNIDFALGIDQSRTYSWKVTTIRTNFGMPFLVNSLAYDDRRPLKRRKAGSAAHRRHLRRIEKGGAK